MDEETDPNNGEIDVVVTSFESGDVLNQDHACIDIQGLT